MNQDQVGTFAKKIKNLHAFTLNRKWHLWPPTAGAGYSEEAVDAVQSAVGSATPRALVHALHFVHHHVHHRGACFHVPLWQQQWTPEWQACRWLSVNMWSQGQTHVYLRHKASEKYEKLFFSKNAIRKKETKETGDSITRSHVQSLQILPSQGDNVTLSTCVLAAMSH